MERISCFFEVEYNTKSECSLVPEHSTLPARSTAQTLPCTIDLINSMREGHWKWFPLILEHWTTLCPEFLEDMQVQGGTHQEPTLKGDCLVWLVWCPMECVPVKYITIPHCFHIVIKWLEQARMHYIIYSIIIRIGYQSMSAHKQQQNADCHNAIHSRESHQWAQLVVEEAYKYGSKAASKAASCC